ncbi:MAG: hypothetical protein LH469_11710 [Frankiaceae bacterium]|nr:hypothetical protein [Frankiaceae bacterium]
MNTQIVAKVALGVLLAATAACGGGDSEEPDRARTITAPSASASTMELEGGGERTLTEAELQAVLLTVSELPTGYTAAAPTEDEDSDTTAEGECQDKFQSLTAAEDSEAASGNVL